MFENQDYQKLSKKLCSQFSHQLEVYIELIETENRKYNLTAFSGLKLWKEGIYDSLFSLQKIAQQLPLNFSFLDIGAGAGFPSIPFLICNPHLKLTIIEPLKKRFDFLLLVKQKLNLNFDLYLERCETFKSDKPYQLITARALMPLQYLIEASIHLGNLETHYWFLKGQNLEDEIKKAKGSLKLFQIKWSIVKLNHIEDKNKQIFTYQKTTKVPQGFPRRWAQIKKKPL